MGLVITLTILILRMNPEGKGSCLTIIPSIAMILMYSYLLVRENAARLTNIITYIYIHKHTCMHTQIHILSCLKLPTAGPVENVREGR